MDKKLELLQNEPVLFSIIVSIYNVEEYLNKCVDSLIHQTYTDIEIILVDDGSSDTCPGICDMYARQDQRVIVIHKKNGGLSDARNTGLNRARGEYVIFVDADDYVEVNMCEKIYPYTKNKIDIIIGGAWITSEERIELPIQTEKTLNGIDYLAKTCRERHFFAPVWNSFFNRMFLLKNEMFFKVGILHEDVLFTPIAWAKADTIVTIPEVFYHNVYRADSITNKKDQQQNILDTYNICCELEDSNQICDDEVKSMLMDVLVCNYIGVVERGMRNKCHPTGIQKAFVMRNAKSKKTCLQAFIFCVSPQLFCALKRVYRGIRGLCSGKTKL